MGANNSARCEWRHESSCLSRLKISVAQVYCLYKCYMMTWEPTTVRHVSDDMRVAASRFKISVAQVPCLCKCYMMTWWEPTTLRDVSDDMCVAASRLNISVAQVHCLCKCYMMTWEPTTLWDVSDDMCVAASRLISISVAQVDCLCKCYMKKPIGGRQLSPIYITLVLYQHILPLISIHTFCFVYISTWCYNTGEALPKFSSDLRT
jgi:hypothetical protein